VTTLTFAADESGDVSFAFAKGASRHFVLAAVGTDDPEALRRLVIDLRSRIGLPVQFEFKFNAMTPAMLRRFVLPALAGAEFNIWAVVADKRRLAEPFRMMRATDVYLFFVTELIRVIPEARREGATLILDQFRPGYQLLADLRRAMVARGIKRNLKRVLVRDSRDEYLIQVADLVAGSLMRMVAHDDPEAFDCLRNKAQEIARFV